MNKLHIATRKLTHPLVRHGCVSLESSRSRFLLGGCGLKSRSYCSLPGVDKTGERSQQSWVKPDGYDTGIHIYNSLTHKKEPLILPQGRVASWYSCGPTVYDHAHIGHASSYVRQDVIRRVLQDMFHIDVVQVMGITDIDDKIIRRSRESKVEWSTLTQQFEASFVQDMKHLHVRAPSMYTRVTDHVPQIVAFIQRIIDNGYAYPTPSGSVYFDIKKYDGYGQLYRPQMDDESSEEEFSHEKRHRSDFALWKATKPGEPYWCAPWGNGRPGWHIECSTMASEIFGKALDIHSGGMDLKFPHHENELAQSQAHHCCSQWTNYWLHTGHLHLQHDSKMSKSLGNTILISDLLKKFTANQFRIFCMMRPYRHAIEYNYEAMDHSKRVEAQWRSFLISARNYIHGKVNTEVPNEAYIMFSLERTKHLVEKSLQDDFDTPRAITAINELIRRCNTEIAPVSGFKEHARCPAAISAVSSYLDKTFRTLGVNFHRHKGHENENNKVLSNVMNAALEFRHDIRLLAKDKPKDLSENERKNLNKRNSLIFQYCDRFRDDLSDHVELKDSDKGSTWEIVSKNPERHKT